MCASIHLSPPVDLLRCKQALVSVAAIHCRQQVYTTMMDCTPTPNTTSKLYPPSPKFLFVRDRTKNGGYHICPQKRSVSPKADMGKQFGLKEEEKLTSRVQKLLGFLLSWSRNNAAGPVCYPALRMFVSIGLNPSQALNIPRHRGSYLGCTLKMLRG